MKKSLFLLAFVACFALGAPDLATAEKECDGGNMKSCAEAGLQCKDEVKKLKLFEKACDGGDGVACGMLADMYGNGDGVAMDKTKAAVYDKKGCDLAGELMSCFNFAAFNYNANDKSKAAQYFKKACDLGKNKNSLFMNLPEFKETWQKSCDMYELLK